MVPPIQRRIKKDMPDPIRIGFVGVGQIGKFHLNSYAKIPEAKVVALCDIDVPELNRVAGLHHITDTYTDFHELLKREDIDAVDVCLHNNLHMPVTVAALRAGKHVYCEKPMAGAYCDAAQMLQVAHQEGKLLSVQLSTLFAKETKAAKLIMDQGLLGKPYHARSVGFRRRGRPWVDGYGSIHFVQKEWASGGAMFDMGVYHIAQTLYLLGNPQVARVSGKTYQAIDMDPTRRDNSGYNVEELGLGFVRFAGDLTLDIIEPWAIHLDKLDGSCIVGPKGGLRLDPFGFFQGCDDLDLNMSANLDTFDQRLHDLRANPTAYDSPQQHWIAALQGRVPLLPTAELALNTMLISEGIYLSNRLGREVTADEVRDSSKSTAFVL
jgi:predicted dehydrogenase